MFLLNSSRGLSLRAPFKVFDPLDSEVLTDMVSRYRAGDLTLRDELITCYYGLAMRIASQFARQHPEQSDDLIGEAMLALTRAVDLAQKVLYDDGLTSFVLYKLHYGLKEYIRVQRHRQMSTVPTGYEPGRLCERQQEIDAEELLNGLSKRDRQIMELKAEGHTVREIADVIGLNFGHVSRRLETIRRRLACAR